MPESLALLADYCCEFLVHAADVEGLCQGIDEALVECGGPCAPTLLSRRVSLSHIVAGLGRWSSIPVTYAGGAKELADIELVDRLSNGKVDLTFGRCDRVSSDHRPLSKLMFSLQRARYLWRFRCQVPGFGRLERETARIAAINPPVASLRWSPRQSTPRDSSFALPRIAEPVPLHDTWTETFRRSV